MEQVIAEKLGHKGSLSQRGLLLRAGLSQAGDSDRLVYAGVCDRRVAGWLAHWKEQLGENRIFRPTQIYTGPRSQTYVDIEDRPQIWDKQGFHNSPPS
jgi:citrate synthase